MAGLLAEKKYVSSIKIQDIVYHHQVHHTHTRVLPHERVLLPWYSPPSIPRTLRKSDHDLSHCEHLEKAPQKTHSQRAPAIRSLQFSSCCELRAKVLAGRHRLNLPIMCDGSKSCNPAAQTVTWNRTSGPRTQHTAPHMVQAAMCDGAAGARQLRLYLVACMTFLSDGWSTRLPWWRWRSD